MHDTGERIGLECPHCGCRHFHTVDVRGTRMGRVRRRRECRHCGWRCTTLEVRLSDPLASPPPPASTLNI